MKKLGNIEIQDVKFDFKDFWKSLWELLYFVRKQIFLLLFMTFLFEAIRLVGPYILKIIIDLLTNFNPEEIGKILLLTVGMFATNQAVSILDFFVDKSIMSSLVKINLNLSVSAHQKMVELDLAYHEKEDTGNKIVKIKRGIDKINDLWGNLFWDVVPTAFQIILTTITLFFVDIKFGFTFLVFVPFFILITLKVNRQVFPYRKTRFDFEEDAAGKMTQSIVNINTVKSFVQEKREKKNFLSVMEKIVALLRAEYDKIFKANLEKNLIIDLGRITILLFGIYLLTKDNITLGSLVFIYTISEKALVSLYRISRLYDRIMESGEAVRRLYTLSLEESSIKNKPNGLKPIKIGGQIDFENVTFSYNRNSPEALKDVSVTIPAGCVTALVGPSGGGKTTVARMIYRHYDPTSGQVLLDGEDLRDYDLQAFRRFIAIVPQEVEIFNASVKENISYAKPSATLQEIKAAAKIANAEEFIQNLENDYETLVGERGIKLSGGQRQRVGIARAILANPRILIFDEATSSLDSQSEKLIQEALDKISNNRTVIVIAHRLSTIKKSHKIIVLEKGRVVEEGSHIELSQKDKGLYQKLLSLQRMGDVG